LMRVEEKMEEERKMLESEIKNRSIRRGIQEVESAENFRELKIAIAHLAVAIVEETEEIRNELDSMYS